MTASTVSPSAGTHPVHSRIHPAQRIITFSGLAIIVGSFLTWINSPIHSFGGFEGAGRFTFYLGVIVMGAGILPLRTVAGIQALLAASATAYLTVWQVFHAIDLLGYSNWLPGPGLIIVMLSAFVTIGCVFRMFTTSPKASPRL